MVNIGAINLEVMDATSFKSSIKPILTMFEKVQ